jgi:hypothetical protein
MCWIPLLVTVDQQFSLRTPMNKSILIAALIAAASLTACGKKEEAAPAPAPAAAPAPAPMAAASAAPASAPADAAASAAAGAAATAASK